RDEPTAGLDPLQIKETLALLRELGEKHTVLLSTHILQEVEAVCERVIIINSGKIGLIQYLHEMESKAVIIVEARGPAEQVAGVLRGLQGVTKVVTLLGEEGMARLEVHTHES